MSQYKTGTVTTTNGSATVTGSGTSWLANISVGDLFALQAPGVPYNVAYEVGSVDSDTQITLTAPFNSTASGNAYVLHRDFHPNGNPKFANGDVEIPAILNRWTLRTADKESIVAQVEDVSVLYGFIADYDGQQISLKGWHPDSDVGGGILYWDASKLKSEHNGGTVFSPTVPWTTTTADYLNGVGETDSGGSGCWVRVIVGNRVESNAFGIIPDGVTDWGDTGVGVLRNLFIYSSNTGVVIVFTPGWYASTFDNYWSNVSVHFEKGAIFGGTVHAAINPDASNPNLSRPSNVRFTGEVGSYQRVGTYNCDYVYIESIKITEDAARDYNGFRGAGVHFYNSTKNLTVGSIYVEASERSYGLGIDTNNAELPENIHIDKVYIAKSYTHGAAFVCKNTKIDQLIIDDYGVGLLTDTNITASVPGSTVPTSEFQGFIVDGGEYPQFGQVVVNSSNPSADASRGAWLNSSSLKVDKLVIRDAPSQGVTNTSSAISVFDEIDVRSSGTDGINNQGGMVCTSATLVQNGDRGLEQSQGYFFAEILKANDNTAEGVYISNGDLNAGSISCSNNNVGGWQVTISNSRGSIGSVSTSRTASGLGGGVQFLNDLSGFSVGNLRTNNDGLITGNIAAVFMDPCDGLTVNSAHLQGDNGASSSQPLRMLNVTDVNFNGLIIENEFNGNGIAVATYSRLSFSNSNNKTGVTNVSRAAGAAEFNCLNCTNP